MSIRNISTGENISYPLLAAVDQRGAGEASFSPNNQYLAWMEANGWQMAEAPNFHQKPWGCPKIQLTLFEQPLFFYAKKCFSAGMLF